MPTPITHAFTCTGPYAILIMTGLKCVENRSAMPYPAQGRCALSVSKKFCKGEFDGFMKWFNAHSTQELQDKMPTWDEVSNWPGKIIGIIDYRVKQVADCTSQELHEREIWNEGYGCWWHLSSPQLLSKPIPVRGNTGFWKLPADIANKFAACLCNLPRRVIKHPEKITV